MKTLKYILLVAFFILFGHLFSSTTNYPQVREVGAQVTNLECTGRELADYMNQVMANSSGINRDKIKLLTPTFNATNPIGAQIANAIEDGVNGFDLSQLDGVSLNAYNCCGNSITGHVGVFMGDTELDMPILIAESGDVDKNLVGEYNKVQNNDSFTYIGAILFNALGNYPDLAFQKWVFNSLDDIRNRACGGSCQKLGVNSGQFYGSESPGIGSGFFEDAQSLANGEDPFFVLSIANADSTTLGVIEDAVDRGLTPVVRVGWAGAPGPDAITYGGFIKNLDKMMQNKSGKIYVIIGPNEPQTECWAAPECGCDLSPSSEGAVKRPLQSGFYLGKYSCKETADNEFHPLRPYPASSCDLLIPRSIPEAPRNAPLDSLKKKELGRYKKYNTFACGTNLEFSHNERFDPYGIWDSYGFNNTGTIIVGSAGQQYIHTYCEEPTEDKFTTGTYTQNCYRTIGYAVYSDFSSSNIGILANTQNRNITDAQKVNNYLSWYFTGTPQIGDRKLLDPNNPDDMARLVAFSGPIRKLLPYEAQQIIRELLIEDASDDRDEIHDYALNKEATIRLSTINETLEQYFPNIPNSTLEDIAGEAFPTSYLEFGDGARGPADSDIKTAGTEFTITCAVPANENCPAVGAVSIPPGEGGPIPPGGSGGCATLGTSCSLGATCCSGVCDGGVCCVSPGVCPQ